ncbi:hypothetical protein H0I23_08035 [Cellulophaga sp. HaHaR_3_176]|uniref:hypothetical protein n=1 Tax=Cellulophaga sp. HaHaR_3_176 TaxID=1942464 RepID=UPI001C1F2BB3|nr:hypothetical protein [Cellulophaga sp. HaHaR_3_176]QWX85576.1 hypothetical protein H0I23_08035 [Cellulophaga sp. HaHaR_3_176]
MEKPCSIAPTNKKEYISNLGKVLVEQNGKKKYYKPEEVKKAHKNRNRDDYFDIDFECYGMSIFCSHSDFDTYHQETGEVCDYVAMKTEMLSGLSVSTNADWTDISDLNIDASWLDFGDVFEGIGEFIGGIFDGL